MARNISKLQTTKMSNGKLTQPMFFEWILSPNVIKVYGYSSRQYVNEDEHKVNTHSERYIHGNDIFIACDPNG
jgi:hypothetical protein